MKAPRILITLIIIAIATSCVGKQNIVPDKVIISDRLSNQYVNALNEDELGFIWIGTNWGLNRYDSKEYHQYFHDETDSLSLPSNIIVSLFKDSKGRLWVGTQNGLCYYNPSADNFVRIPLKSTIKIVSQIWEEPDGRIFINSIEQLSAYDTLSKSIKVVIENFDSENSFVNECHMEEDGNFWSISRHHARHYNGNTLELMNDILLPDACIYSKLMSDGCLALASQNKLSFLDTKTGIITDNSNSITNHPAFKEANTLLIYELFDKFPLYFTDKGFFLQSDEGIVYEPDKNMFYNVPIEEYTCAFRDSRSDVWIGTQNNGALDIKRQGDSPFGNKQTLFRKLDGLSVIGLSKTQKGNLLAVTSSDRFFFGNQENGINQELIPEGIPNRSTENSTIHIDSSDRIWLLRNEHLYQLIKDGDKIKILRDCHEISSQVTAFYEDNNGTIWIGGRGLYFLKKGDNSFQSISVNGLSKISYITSILSLPDGQLMLGMALRNPIIFNPKTLESKDIEIWTDSETLDMVEDMDMDLSGKVWIGTSMSGIYRYDPKTGKCSKMSGLACQAVRSVACDGEGNIWISTLNGLSQWKQSNGIIHNYSSQDGIGGTQFNAQAKVLLNDGSVIFGGIHGVTAFSAEIDEDFKETPIYFENLTVNGVLAAPGSAFAKTLPYSPSINLNWKNNYFTISYASLDFGGLTQSRYEYRLNGLGKEWVDNGNNTTISLSYLKPGKYTLEVRTVPSNERRPVSYASIPIRISPAPWSSWWAWTIYLLTLLSIIYFAYSYRIRIIKEREVAKRAEFEKDQEKRLNEMNMSFFNNISHEFRTPLTLISGPVIQMEKGTATPQMLSTIKWNVARMLRLVNQLMDFGKLEKDALKLEVSEQEIIGLLKQTIGAFAFSMHEKGINLQTSGLEGEFRCLIDSDKLDKIVSNLLSNAMKYTPSGGTVSIGFDVLSSDKGKVMSLSVSDDGPKIPKESLERIFEKYYQVENNCNYGTGIGLYFSKRLALLHHGDLRCNNMEGDGVVFTLELPAENVYRQDEIVSDKSQNNPYFTFTESGASLESTQEHDKTVLVVDDDPGIVSYLKILLQPLYNVKTAFSAVSALEAIHTAMPELIISDVAMPGMDGYEFCRIIKDDVSLCHIPVILVTAKTTVEQQVEGLSKGADAYVTKPFNPDYLLALIDSQLKNRERLHSLFGEATTIEKVEEENPGINEQDKKFMEEFYSLMEKELSNDAINIDQFAEKLYVSRSKFYYKVKALTGESPNNFFKEYKLNRSKELLDSGKYRISEIADMTGFSTLSVFGRNFKAKFGLSPTEYLESKRKA